MEKRVLRNEECNEEHRDLFGEPFEENSFWKAYDKLAVIIRKPGFFYWSIGLMIFGTVLGVIAPYLD